MAAKGGGGAENAYHLPAINFHSKIKSNQNPFVIIKTKIIMVDYHQYTNNYKLESMEYTNHVITKEKENPEATSIAYGRNQ